MRSAILIAGLVISGMDELTIGWAIVLLVFWAMDVLELFSGIEKEE